MQLLLKKSDNSIARTVVTIKLCLL